MSVINELALDAKRRRLYVLRGTVFVYTEQCGIWEETSHIPTEQVDTMAIDQRNGRLLLLHRQLRELRTHCLDSLIRTPISRDLRNSQGIRAWFFPYMICDESNDAVYITDFGSTVTVLSAKDLTLLRVVCFDDSTLPDRSFSLASMAVDSRRQRLLCSGGTEFFVFSLPDFTILYPRDGCNSLSPTLADARAICVDNHNRLIIGDGSGGGLCAFTTDYDYISQFDVETKDELVVIFDEARGVFIYAKSGQLYCVPANSWLPDTYAWTVARREHAPAALKQVVSTVAAIRSLVESPLSLIPNELLFLIFECL